MTNSNDTFSLAGRKALVTGSTRGIGAAIATTFVRAGADVLIHGRSKSSLGQNPESRLRELGGVAGFHCAELGEAGAAQQLFDETGPVDILVVNAAMQIRRDFSEITPRDFEEQVRVNFQSTLELIQRYSPPMLESGWGRILMVGSVQEVKPNPQLAVYAAIKGAISNLTRNLAKQFAEKGVTVNTLTPGAIATDMNRDVLKDDGYRRQVVAAIPAGRIGMPEDCTGPALMLCSQAGSYITGVTLLADGGMSL